MEPQYLSHEVRKANIDKMLGRNEQEEFEKGGEGSRGGKVIGHTVNGKPIYDNYFHASHKKFTTDEKDRLNIVHNKKAMSESNYSPKEDDQVSFLDYEGNMQSGTIQKVHSNGHSFTVSFRKPNGNLATHSIQRHQIKK